MDKQIVVYAAVEYYVAIKGISSSVHCHRDESENYRK
jgi:hypothetical protein